MKAKIGVIITFLTIIIGSNIYGQKFDISGSKKGSKVFYKDGTTEYGKLKYDDKSLSIKYEDKSKKKININTVEKFEIYKKKDTVAYTYILSKRNYKKKKKQKYLAIIAWDYENVKIYNEPTTAARVGAFSIGQAVYFIQKKGDPYAEKLVKPYVNMHKRLKEYFSECPSLVEKIGTDFKFKKYKSLTPILEYYNNNCR
ncbi:hypothetical protein [Aquimarina litoralis]|uniref:hypothetical protein n=1 Tax=Aquimarina litoralis TaxID=584605 RepID=UPI001C58DFBF|nr:hypothetical protein [Aquimarina litoralis]MBW1296092.1 hypothetical protein [Aquimarina litoralis]